MIQVGFSTQTHNILSRMIRAVTKSRASHAWLLVDDSLFGCPLVLEATEVGIRLIPFKTFQVKNTVVHLSPAHVEASMEVGLRAMSVALGNAYDFTGLFGMFFVYLGRLFRKKWRNPIRSSKAMFCSEFVCRVLQSARWPGAEALDPDSTSPEDLLVFIEGDAP
jgi:hypothetical protein